MDFDGSDPKKLTTEGGVAPNWSPDGKKIVYSQYNGWEFTSESGMLWIMDADGSNKRQLTSYNVELIEDGP
ncbi:MAG: hypothetical protein QMD71_01885 [bacterium]|nr:hypothetical protein [bacterium]